MRSTHTQDNQKIAVFIDFENISLSAANHFGEFDLGLLLKAIQRRGRITLRRAYGDWSRLIKYRDALRENAVELVQLYSYNVAGREKPRRHQACDRRHGKPVHAGLHRHDSDRLR